MDDIDILAPGIYILAQDDLVRSLEKIVEKVQGDNTYNNFVRANYEKNVFGTECDYYDDYVRHFREKQDSLEQLHSHLVDMQEFMGSQSHTQEIHRDTKDISHILADLFEQLERIYIAKQANSKNFNIDSLEDNEFIYL